MKRKILPSKNIAVLAGAGAAVSSENRLATSVVSVNAKEGKTQKENHRSEIFRKLLDVGLLEFAYVKPGQTYQYRSRSASTQNRENND